MDAASSCPKALPIGNAKPSPTSNSATNPIACLLNFGASPQVEVIFGSFVPSHSDTGVRWLLNV